MEITEVRVKMVGDSKDRLKAYCSITIEGCFVIRDLKVIEGTNGLFVAMPSRKLATRCPKCGGKNHLRARYCNDCAADQGSNASARTSGRGKLHADIAHPINTDCRKFIQERVIEEFHKEVERSKQPDYEGSRYDDGYDDIEKDYDEQDERHESKEQEHRDERKAEPRKPAKKPAERVSPYEQLIRDLKGESSRHQRRRRGSSGPVSEPVSADFSDYNDFDDDDDDNQELYERDAFDDDEQDEEDLEQIQSEREPFKVVDDARDEADDNDAFGAGLEEALEMTPTKPPVKQKPDKPSKPSPQPRQSKPEPRNEPPAATPARSPAKSEPKSEPQEENADDFGVGIL